MVKSAINAQQRATNGLKILLGSEPMTQVQANWRFLNNPQATIKELHKPLVEHLEKEITTQCDKYILALEDWSHLDYWVPLEGIRNIHRKKNSNQKTEKRTV